MNAKKRFIAGSALLAIFIIFTLLITLVDVKASGESGAMVGFSSVNSAFFECFGSNDGLDTVSDVILLLSFAYVFGFALVGALQLIKRKSLFKVDKHVLLMGALMVVLAIIYVVFELFEINCRPILVDGVLEASYPSTHVLFSTTILASSTLLLQRMVKNRRLLIAAYGITASLGILGIVSRTLSGAHWITDIVASVILSLALVTLFSAALALADKSTKKDMP